MDLYSKLIEKPKMQEKLLRKPPPRYVYDILMATMAVTGYPKGLYTEEETTAKFFDEV
jgi:TRAF3-interacting protein 1